jgi:hypothetical protein
MRHFELEWLSVWITLRSAERYACNLRIHLTYIKSPWRFCVISHSQISEIRLHEHAPQLEIEADFELIPRLKQDSAITL